jgi:hypothetical protein
MNNLNKNPGSTFVIGWKDIAHRVGIHLIEDRIRKLCEKAATVDDSEVPPSSQNCKRCSPSIPRR